MTTKEAVGIELDPELVGTLELQPGFEVPYVDIEDLPRLHSRLRLGGVEYAYERSYPLHGYSAVMPEAIAELQAKGRKVLVAERTERYYVFVA